MNYFSNDFFPPPPISAPAMAKTRARDASPLALVALALLAVGGECLVLGSSGAGRTLSMGSSSASSGIGIEALRADMSSFVAEANRIRAQGKVSVSRTIMSAAGIAPSTNQAYATRTQRPGWESRWGEEEVARLSAAPVPAPQGGASTTSSSVSAASAGSQVMDQVGLPSDPAALKALVMDHQRAMQNYLIRSGEAASKKDLEIAQLKKLVAQLSAGGSGGGAPPPAPTGAAGAMASSTVHPAYAKRADRQGWEGRWGAEEASRTAASPPLQTAPPAASPSSSTANAVSANEAQAYLAEYVVRSGEERSKAVAAAAAAAKKEAADTIAALRSELESLRQSK
jgi:hypothetical protein